MTGGITQKQEVARDARARAQPGQAPLLGVSKRLHGRIQRRPEGVRLNRVARLSPQGPQRLPEGGRVAVHQGVEGADRPPAEQVEVRVRLRIDPPGRIRIQGRLHRLQHHLCAAHLVVTFVLRQVVLLGPQPVARGLQAVLVRRRVAGRQGSRTPAAGQLTLQELGRPPRLPLVGRQRRPVLWGRLERALAHPDAVDQGRWRVAFRIERRENYTDFGQFKVLAVHRPCQSGLVQGAVQGSPCQVIGPGALILGLGIQDDRLQIAPEQQSPEVTVVFRQWRVQRQVLRKQAHPLEPHVRPQHPCGERNPRERVHALQARHHLHHFGFAQQVGRAPECVQCRGRIRVQQVGGQRPKERQPCE